MFLPRSHCRRYASTICLLLVLQPSAPYAADAAEPLPLIPERELKIEAEEATWLGIDVSPDGSTLLLEILGDIYRMPADGGAAQPLTSGLPFDSQPQFSPDGQQIVFISDRGGFDELWLMAADGTGLRRLAEGGSSFDLASPAWAPDGSHVVVSRQSWGLRTYELWAYAVRGGNGVQLTKAKAKADTPTANRSNSLGAVYAPDGQSIYYARKNGGFAYNQIFPLWQIARRNLETGVETVITSLPGSAIKPALSRTGELLAYATRVDQRTRLHVRNLVTGDDRVYALELEADEQESRFTRGLLPNYDFSPDGKAVYLSSAGRPHRLTLASGDAEPLAFSFANRQELGALSRHQYALGTGPVKARALRQPDLAPDGKALVFSAFRQIYRYEIESGTLTTLSPPDVGAFYPRFSPDGQSVAYITWGAEGGHIYRVGARGGRPQRLTRHPGYYRELAYSPDGKRLVTLRGSTFERRLREYDNGPTADADLVWLPAAGGEPTVIAPATRVSRLHFAADPDRIYFNVNASDFARTESGGLVSIRFDGSDRRSEQSVIGPGIYSAEGDVQVGALKLAPGGKQVAILHARQLYLTERLNPALPKQKLKLTAAELPIVRLTSVGADHVLFDAAGEAVYWLVGSTLYRRPLDSIGWATEERKASDDDQEPDVDAADASTPETAQPADFASFVALEAHAAVEHWPIDVYRPRVEPRGQLALVGATVLPMTGATTPAVIEDATVLIEGARITAVGRRTEVAVPEAAHVVDASGQYLLPGFVDPHAHFRPYRDALSDSDWSLLANLAFGVTTGLDVQPSTLDVLAYEEATDAGLMIGPRTLSTGPGIFSNNRFSKPEDPYFVLKRYRDHYGVRNLKAYIAGDRKQRQWLVQAARALKLNPTTEGALDMKLGLTHALDGFSGNEHNLPLQTLYSDVVQFVAGSGMSVVPTLLVLYGGPWGEEHFYSRESPAGNARLLRFTPKAFVDRRTQRRGIWVADAEERFQQVARQALKLQRAGAPIGVGSHGQLQGLGYHWELWALASGGFTAREALRAATIDGARIIGVDRDIGSVAVGKLADLVLLPRNPLEDLRATAEPTHVLRGGFLYDAATLDRVWPDPEPLPEQWWQ
ncbi:MAG: amidohydrolase family protein [Pseudomonadota bacterium]